MECKTETGITVGLLDAIITLANALEERDWSPIEVQEALKDIRANDNLHKIMDIGDLISAKNYIQDQRKTINILADSLHLANTLLADKKEESK